MRINVTHPTFNPPLRGEDGIRCDLIANVEAVEEIQYVKLSPAIGGRDSAKYPFLRRSGFGRELLQRGNCLWLLLSIVCVCSLSGCSNKFNQSGSWLVSYDSSLTPRYLDSIKDSLKVTSSNLNLGLVASSDTVLCLGAVPWSEADLVLEFYGLDSVYYATSITSAQVILRRATYVLQPFGYDVHNLRFEGYALDSTWGSGTFTWDSVAQIPRESSNMILAPAVPEVQDSSVVLQIDTSVVRRWGVATQDTSAPQNYGFVVKPMNISGVLSLFSTYYSGTGDEPTIIIACVINGISDTVKSTSSSAIYVATTSINPPSQTLAVQSGTGLHGNFVFDLSRIPNYSVVNYATLTLFSNRIDTIYSGQSPDSLWAYYQTSPTTHALSYSGTALSTEDTVSKAKYTFSVTTIVQQMLNLGNYGFVITRYEDNNNMDPRFIYNANAPDSLKPRLSVTYTPAVRKK